MKLGDIENAGCHVCGKSRRAEELDQVTYDATPRGQIAGTLPALILFCNDDESCRARAREMVRMRSGGVSTRPT